MKRKIFVALYILLDVAILLVIITCHDVFLRWAFNRGQAYIKATYHVNISADKVEFASLTSIHISNLCIQPEGEDTLAVIRNLEFKPSLLSLLARKPTFDKLIIDSATITILNRPDSSNLLFLKSYRGPNKASAPRKLSYYDRAEDWKGRVLKLLNTNFQISNLHINYRDTSRVEEVYVPSMVYDGHNLSGGLINEAWNDTLNITGETVKKSEDYKVRLEHRGRSLCYLPFLDAEHGFKCCFQSVMAEIKFDDANGELHVSPTVSVQNFHIQHWRLAKDDVVFPSAQFSGLLKISGSGFELDSISTITLNHASCRIFTSYQTKPDTVFALNIGMPEIASDTFFNALPGGMFNTLKGISCSGTLSYNLQFAIHTQQPDSLIFESQLKRKNFHIIHYGDENYARINEPFVYDAFSGDQFIRHITVGPDNPEFTPYNRISRYLPAAIMQSEDPSFMVHRGFVPEAFKESIAQNFKERRFARGGSTISMQLVKNVFLNRNKTVSRKAEEALIVYLIENLGLVPKERMMEVYLNVIEWGPNVYGVGEASKFYFNKRPAELSLQESIFLAAIIPNPKPFRYQFDKQGEIKSYMGDFFKLIVNRMVMRGYLNEGDTTHFVPHIKLSGPAANFVLPADNLAPATNDSLPDMDDE
jgi:hypothetical protein